MYAAIVKALVATNGIDLSGKNVEMPAGSYHLVSKHDLRYYLAHPDAFSIVREADLDVPALLAFDANNNAFLVGPNATIPLQRYSVVQVRINVDTAALAHATAIPFNTVVQDDIGLTTLNFATYPERVYFPSTAKFIRVSFRAAYKYNALYDGTYRGAKPLTYLDGGLATLQTVDEPVIVPKLVVGTATDGIVQAVTGRGAVVSENGLDNNWVQLITQHDSTVATVLNGNTANYAWLQLEVWE